MTATLAQGLQHTLTNTQLRTVLFAVQVEAQRYKDLPKEDLPIEIACLLRARSRLANIVHGIAEETLLLREWEIFLVAIKIELQRYEVLLDEFKPKFVEDLRSALHVVQGTILVDRKEIEKAGAKR